MTELCSAGSRARAEPLTATASRVERWLLVEHRGAWGPESVPSSRMSPQLARSLAATAQAAAARLLLVRRPKGIPADPGRWVFAADSSPGAERLLAQHVARDADLMHLTLPVGAGDRPAGSDEGWQQYDGPLYLVCTHGRHDRCCALLGRPVAQALARQHPDRTWEASHVGGDRFAANVVVLPAGTYLGRVEPDEVARVVDDLAEGLLPAGRVRGRSSLPLPTQAAQAFARQALDRWGVADLDLVRQEAAGPDAWRVRLGSARNGSSAAAPEVEVVVRYDRQGDGGPHVLSCDDPAKVAPVFRQISLAELAPGS
jgi:hypothetical protein